VEDHSARSVDDMTIDTQLDLATRAPELTEAITVLTQRLEPDDVNVTAPVDIRGDELTHPIPSRQR
jgi:hypothetical protein